MTSRSTLPTIAMGLAAVLLPLMIAGCPGVGDLNLGELTGGILDNTIDTQEPSGDAATGDGTETPTGGDGNADGASETPAEGDGGTQEPEPSPDDGTGEEGDGSDVTPGEQPDATDDSPADSENEPNAPPVEPDGEPEPEPEPDAEPVEPPADDGEQLELELYDAGSFSVLKPVGWEIATAGSCSTLAFVMRDPEQPLRQIFFFGMVGPIYTLQEQKDLDNWYVANGGYPHTWLDAPVVNPLSVDNFFAHWPEIAAMQAAADFMAEFPQLENLEVIATAPQDPMVGIPGAQTAVVRGLFVDGGAVGEAQLLGTVAEYAAYTGAPGGGFAYGDMVCGVTAPKREFAALEPRMVEALDSFTIPQSYANQCMADSEATWEAIAAAGQTLSDASDMIHEGWQNRSHSEDIMAEKRSDAILGNDRVYNPDTSEVYEVGADWYQQYDLNRGTYEMGNLQPLPGEDWDLWTAAPLDGTANIH